jgi:hypothetical protein
MGVPESATSKNDVYATPRYVLDPLVRAFGRIGLDPASHPISVVESDTAILLPEYAPQIVKGARRTVYANGLHVDWRGHGLVFCNPPYSDGTARRTKEEKAEDDVLKAAGLPVPKRDKPNNGGLADFLEMAWRLRRDFAVESWLLVPARTGNVYWPHAAGKADAEVRLARVTHVGQPTHAPFHSWLLYFGPRVELALQMQCLGDVRIHPRHALLRPHVGPLRP